MGDRKGAVFGGLVDAPLKPMTKRRYQVIWSRILKHVTFVFEFPFVDVLILILVFDRVQIIHLFSQMYLANQSYFVPQVSPFSLNFYLTFKVWRANFCSLFLFAVANQFIY